jgi:hypothetical protein
MSRLLYFLCALLLFSFVASAEENSCSKSFTRLSDQLIPKLQKAFDLGNVLFYPLVEPVMIAGKAIKNTPNLNNLKTLQKALSVEASRPEVERRLKLWFLSVATPYVIVDGTSLFGAGFTTATQLESQLLNPAGPKVFVEALQEGSNGYGAEEASFQARYASDSKSVFIRAKNIKELKVALQEIAGRLGPIQLLEVNAHGEPGAMIFPDGRVEEGGLGPGMRGVMAKGAIIRLVSCEVARDLKNAPVGQSFLKAFGKSFLDQGGKIIGSTRFVFEDRERASSGLKFGALMIESAGEFILGIPKVASQSAQLPFETFAKLPAFIDWIRSGSQPEFRVIEIPAK